MEKAKLIAGLKTLEQQIIEVLDNVDDTRRKFLPFVERDFSNREGLKVLVHTLHQDVMQLRHLYQQVTFKMSLLIEPEGGNHQQIN